MDKKQPDTTDKPNVSFADDKKFTVEALAEELGYSTKTIYGWIKERKLKATQFKGSRKIIITATDLNEYRDEYNTLKHWFSTEIGNVNELDPAFVPPKLEAVDIDSLTEEQFLNAFISPSELGLNRAEPYMTRQADVPLTDKQISDIKEFFEYLKIAPEEKGEPMSGMDILANMK